MALPTTLNPASPAGTDSPGQGDDEFRSLKQLLVDLFGFPTSPTQITAAPFAIAAGGNVTVVQHDLNFYNGYGVMANSVRVAQFNTMAGGVNYLTFTPAASGSGPSVRVEGSDADISFVVGAKGFGSVQFMTNAVVRWSIISPSGNFVPVASATYDLGGSVNQVRDLWASGVANVGSIRVGNAAVTGVAANSIVLANDKPIQWVDFAGATTANHTILVGADNHLTFSIPNLAGQHFAFKWGILERAAFTIEQDGAGLLFLNNASADHSNPAGSGVVIYTVVGLGGKIALMARFPSGAAQQLAIEP